MTQFRNDGAKHDVDLAIRYSFDLDGPLDVVALAGARYEHVTLDTDVFVTRTVGDERFPIPSLGIDISFDTAIHPALFLTRARTEIDILASVLGVGLRYPLPDWSASLFLLGSAFPFAHVERTTETPGLGGEFASFESEESSGFAGGGATVGIVIGLATWLDLPAALSATYRYQLIERSAQREEFHQAGAGLYYSFSFD